MLLTADTIIQGYDSWYNETFVHCCTLVLDRYRLGVIEFAAVRRSVDIRRWFTRAKQVSKSSPSQSLLRAASYLKPRCEDSTYVHQLLDTSSIENIRNTAFHMHLNGGDWRLLATNTPTPACIAFFQYAWNFRERVLAIEKSSIVNALVDEVCLFSPQKIVGY